MKWSRALPSQPSTVIAVKDAAGRYFASFVADTDPADDLARMPETDATVGIDLGLTHFAVLSDGRKIDSPRFLRRAEKKLKKAQQSLSRKTKGSGNRGRQRVKVARSVHDAGWSSFVSMLEYKAVRHGRELVRIGRFEPTSQVCSTCGVKDGPKPLHVRDRRWGYPRPSDFTRAFRTTFGMTPGEYRAASQETA